MECVQYLAGAGCSFKSKGSEEVIFVFFFSFSLQDLFVTECLWLPVPYCFPHFSFRSFFLGQKAVPFSIKFGSLVESLFGCYAGFEDCMRQNNGFGLGGGNSRKKLCYNFAHSTRLHFSLLFAVFLSFSVVV